MKWPTSISGQILYPLSCDGYQVDVEQTTLWLIHDNALHRIEGTPVFDQRWLFPTTDGRRPPLAGCYRQEFNALRAMASAKHTQVCNLISEISEIMIQAHEAERKYRGT